MKKVTREELVDYVTYNEEVRPSFREHVLASKKPRRVHIGEHVTLLFETADTVRYQVQEMMRIEQLVKESDIQHELDTYNELLGGDGELGFTMLIEIDSPEERAVKLVEWHHLPEHIYARLSDGSKVYASFDTRQVGTERLSSVQYMKLDTGGRTPVAIGTDHPAYTVEMELSDETRRALTEDLTS